VQSCGHTARRPLCSPKVGSSSGEAADVQFVAISRRWTFQDSRIPASPPGV